MLHQPLQFHLNDFSPETKVQENVVNLAYLATGKFLLALPLKVFTLAVEEVGTKALAEVDTVAAIANKAIVFFITNTMVE